MYFNFIYVILITNIKFTCNYYNHLGFNINLTQSLLSELLR